MVLKWIFRLPFSTKWMSTTVAWWVNTSVFRLGSPQVQHETSGIKVVEKSMISISGKLIQKSDGISLGMAFSKEALLEDFMVSCSIGVSNILISQYHLTMALWTQLDFRPTHSHVREPEDTQTMYLPNGQRLLSSLPKTEKYLIFEDWCHSIRTALFESLDFEINLSHAFDIFWDMSFFLDKSRSRAWINILLLTHDVTCGQL